MLSRVKGAPYSLMDTITDSYLLTRILFPALHTETNITTQSAHSGVKLVTLRLLSGEHI